jgi:hypothetical protein
VQAEKPGSIGGCLRAVAYCAKQFFLLVRGQLSALMYVLYFSSEMVP